MIHPLPLISQPLYNTSEVKSLTPKKISPISRTSKIVPVRPPDHLPVDEYAYRGYNRYGEEIEFKKVLGALFDQSK